MKFRYVCVDCGKELETDEIIYQCPECAAKQKEGEFPRGYLKVIYDAEDLRKLAGKEHVTIYDFFPYEVPNKEVYPVGTTPICFHDELPKKKPPVSALPEWVAAYFPEAVLAIIVETRVE